MPKREALTIGELSRRTGIPVKTLRFYSDEGLLPPAGRSRANYRLYDEEQVVRVELVRTLREAGVDLATIRKVLARNLSLEDALRLRLAAVEAHVASLSRIAAALRAALRTEPTEKDLRRLWTVTRLSNEERKAVITRFYDQVADGVPVDGEWMRGMIEASSPKLPDDATPAQLEAWIELAEILADPTFVANMRVMAAVTWNEEIDHAALLRAQSEAVAAAREARGRGVDPHSAEALAIAERFVWAAASANGRELDDAFAEQLRKTQDPRALRYWELVSAMTGEPLSPAYEDGRWLGAAIARFLER
ncbi:helix-turn-helix domain-containing protein [Polyangium jinanense]|uniref:MerR family transcriptional regulator n=1 Tax=Polyangium jinanense TaxID=2829994 RepID=A0A9X3X2I2_9BACT|nr:MerR family transcriptional regulator [Polyangium jinanense]MDC3955294.1 MerR family transcriptional regulator [Polyangium jinanense]MDC3981595.1 MerR family transcriptional regulator [Polyangium jinanense]